MIILSFPKMLLKFSPAFSHIKIEIFRRPNYFLGKSPNSRELMIK